MKVNIPIHGFYVDICIYIYIIYIYIITCHIYIYVQSFMTFLLIPKKPCPKRMNPWWLGFIPPGFLGLCLEAWTTGSLPWEEIGPNLSCQWWFYWVKPPVNLAMAGWKITIFNRRCIIKWWLSWRITPVSTVSRWLRTMVSTVSPQFLRLFHLFRFQMVFSWLINRGY